ncbi:serine/threonine protein phosphatase [Thecamonas trahens ATCC 50062]|uniref:Serine/threonine-protein phosphatase n=1 Tax=Thecamonas trahens ATCC 50062 TaxID=461836 RepID=A0A0L0DSS8_THETB|nr:serine/threonine protein phosphatase [Thecamonas trahens ATCC 50062]KNC55061.1 serine/threonine protein phosphatase [Thecamonas trahens ATCC 50062]|eukprot:XP_013753365.1 serine/threonine protein phosphatase [Thecamonas trahens ATCC 50062]
MALGATAGLTVYTLAIYALMASSPLPALQPAPPASEPAEPAESAPAPSAEYSVSPTYHVLEASGMVRERRTLPTRNFTHSTQEVFASSALGAQPDALSAAKEVAEAVLSLLGDAFLPLADGGGTGGAWDEPSHGWRSDGEREAFILMLRRLVPGARATMLTHPSLVSLPDPVYVLGDLHGNYSDLAFFARTFWGAGVPMCPAKILFLGDYVDRGPHSVETLAFVLALATAYPQHVVALRGNHELADINGDIEVYEDGSFRAQCHELLGSESRGEALWTELNSVCETMPLAAVINSRIFAVHGGIPRTCGDDPLAAIAALPRPLSADAIASIMDDTVAAELTADSPADAPAAGLVAAMDLLWSDPAEDETELAAAPAPGFPHGFAPSDRGGGTAVFGHDAVAAFLATSGCSHIIRAHQAPSLGVSYAKSAQVITIFSSSHYAGGHNSAAIALVAEGAIRVMVTSKAGRDGAGNAM